MLRGNVQSPPPRRELLSGAEPLRKLSWRMELVTSQSQKCTRLLYFFHFYQSRTEIRIYQITLFEYVLRSISLRSQTCYVYIHWGASLTKRERATVWFASPSRIRQSILNIQLLSMLTNYHSERRLIPPNGERHNCSRKKKDAVSNGDGISDEEISPILWFCTKWEFKNHLHIMRTKLMVISVAITATILMC